MKVTVIGGGGREHALAWRLAKSRGVSKLWASPGNPGIAQIAECVAEPPDSDLTIVGPEGPLVDGVVDRILATGRRAVGPTKAAAELEGSKILAKQIMNAGGIPTARYQAFDDPVAATRALARFEYPLVVKADGLAAGKGVVIVKSRAEAEKTVTEMMAGQIVGDAGRRILLEDFCPGEEVSFIALTDGEHVLPLAPTQDHKQIFDGDRGPNTGGMGTYCDDRILGEEGRDLVMKTVMRPAVQAMARRGTPFSGFLFAGLMMTANGPRVLEFNVRLGDPETQVLMHRLESDFLEPLHACSEGRLREVSLRWKPGPSVCVVLGAHNYPGEPRRGDEITGISAAESTGACVFHAGTKTIGGRLVTNGGRVLGVTASGNTLHTAIDGAYAAVSRIHFDGMHYRRDIGAKGLKRR